MKVHSRQADAFAEGDKNGYTVFFKAFPEGRDRFLTCKHKKTLAKNIIGAPDECRTFQEIIRDGTWINPYWDLDIMLPKLPDDLAQRRKKIMLAFEELCHVVFPSLGETFDKTKLKWSDSSGKTENGFKISLHCVYVADIGFEYNRATKEGRQKRRALHQFGMLCIQNSEKYDALWYDKEGRRTSIIDGVVWSTNRAMRCLGCHKFGSYRTLLPVRDYCVVPYFHDAIVDHLIFSSAGS